MHKLTIITINRNNAEGLRRTIQSVRDQSCTDFEYLVIDGASTDSSLEIIEEFSEFIDQWISEPDAGLYNAMNKGVGKANGDYLFFLNSGDYLNNHRVIENIVKHLEEADVIYGDIVVDTDNGSKIIHSPQEVHYYERYQHHLPPQPATIIKKTLFDKFGLFNENYRIIADVAFISRIFSIKELHYKYIACAFTNFDMKGISSQTQNQDKIYEERKRFISTEFPQYIKDFEKVYQKSLFRKTVGIIKGWMGN